MKSTKYRFSFVQSVRTERLQRRREYDELVNGGQDSDKRDADPSLVVLENWARITKTLLLELGRLPSSGRQR
jgi:hypothetical protein